MDAALDLFAQICREVYPMTDIGAAVRSDALRASVERVLESHAVTSSTLLSQIAGTNVYVRRPSVGA